MQNTLLIQELVVSHIFFRENSEEILQDINVSLHRGKSLSLLGPSGCGKTTLLRIIAGLEKPYSGEILFRGKEMRGVAPHLRNFGMMFQDFALFPHRNVSENISFGLEMKRVPRKEISSRVSEMLELVNLEKQATRDISELSGGERQRVALARTLAPSPDLIMLDEPLGALDRRLRERLLSDLCTILRKSRLTTIWVTHDQSEAFAASDLVCVMNSGKVEQIDSPENLYHNPVNRTVADFLGFQNIMDGKKIGEKVEMILIMPDAATLISEDGSSLSHVEEFSDGSSDIIAGIVMDSSFQGAIRRISIKTSMQNIFRGAGSEQTLFFDIQGQTPIPEVGSPIFLKINPSGIKILNGVES